MSVLPPQISSTPSKTRDTGLATVPVRLLEALAALLMAGIAVLVFANATGRYLFARPLPWTEEVVLNAMVWVAGVGVVLAALRGGMMSCNMLVTLLPPRPLRVVRIVMALAGVALMAFFANATLQFIGLFGGDLTPLLRMPKAIAMYGLLFAILGLALALLIDAFRAFRE